MLRARAILSMRAVRGIRAGAILSIPGALAYTRTIRTDYVVVSPHNLREPSGLAMHSKADALRLPCGANRVVVANHP